MKVYCENGALVRRPQSVFRLIIAHAMLKAQKNHS